MCNITALSLVVHKKKIFFNLHIFPIVVPLVAHAGDTATSYEQI